LHKTITLLSAVWSGMQADQTAIPFWTTGPRSPRLWPNNGRDPISSVPRSGEPLARALGKTYWTLHLISLSYKDQRIVFSFVITIRTFCPSVANDTAVLSLPPLLLPELHIRPSLPLACRGFSISTTHINSSELPSTCYDLIYPIMPAYRTRNTTHVQSQYSLFFDHVDPQLTEY
jgi:hypothetical protein